MFSCLLTPHTILGGEMGGMKDQEDTVLKNPRGLAARNPNPATIRELTRVKTVGKRTFRFCILWYTAANRVKYLPGMSGFEKGHFITCRFCNKRGSI